MPKTAAVVPMRDPAKLVTDWDPGKTSNEMQAQIAWDVTIRNTMVMRESLRRFCPDADLTSLVAEARQLARQVVLGDREYFEATLCAQSTVLDAEACALSKWAADVRDRDPELALSIYDAATRMRQCQVNTIKVLGRKRSGTRARKAD